MSRRGFSLTIDTFAAFSRLMVALWVTGRLFWEGGR